MNKAADHRNKCKQLQRRMAEIAHQRLHDAASIGEHIGMKESTVQRILDGAFPASAETLFAIAAAIDVTITIDLNNG